MNAAGAAQKGAGKTQGWITRTRKEGGKTGFAELTKVHRNFMVFRVRTG